MRALPIVVDLFVLLTIFALVLFYAALGASAPNEPARGLVIFEVSATLEGTNGPVQAQPSLTLRADLVDAAGNTTPGTVSETRADGGVLRFLVRDAPKDTRLRIAVAEILPDAFDHQNLSIQIVRVYPSREETPVSRSPVGRARVSTLGVAPE